MPANGRWDLIRRLKVKVCARHIASLDFKRIGITDGKASTKSTLCGVVVCIHKYWKACIEIYEGKRGSSEHMI